MVNPIRSESVLKLGKQIVNELGLDQTVDTLGRWMAHYIAEKIEDAETATGEERARKMCACMDAVLKLWAHRSELPNGRRPFENFEPIFRVLQGLDPDETGPRYFQHVRSMAHESDEGDQTKHWLNIASELDYTARILIRYCLTNAAQKAVDKSRNWVALTETITKERDIDIKIIRAVMKDADVFHAQIPDDQGREEVEELLKKLEGFVDLVNELSAHLRQQLDGAQSKGSL
jgi:hypothetical protein